MKLCYVEQILHPTPDPCDIKFDENKPTSIFSSLFFENLGGCLINVTLNGLEWIYTSECKSSFLAEQNASFNFSLSGIKMRRLLSKICKFPVKCTSISPSAMEGCIPKEWVTKKVHTSLIDWTLGKLFRVKAMSLRPREP